MEMDAKEKQRVELMNKVELHKKKVADFTKRLKDLDKGPSNEEKQKMQIAYGKAVMILMENNPELTEMVNACLDEKVKPNRTLRKLLGLPLPDMPVDPTAAERKRRSRAKKNENKDAVNETPENME